MTGFLEFGQQFIFKEAALRLAGKLRSDCDPRRPEDHRGVRL
jgi:hypothetical protein